MTDRLLIAYGLMLLLAAGLAAMIWWNVYHSHRRTYERQQAVLRKKNLAAAKPGRERSDGP